MSQTIKLPNYNSSNLREPSILLADHAAGVSVLNVQNTNGFKATSIIYLGRPGGEGSEAVLASAVPTDATHIPITAATKFMHYRNDSVRALFGDQIKVYRAPDTNGLSPDVSTYAYLDIATIDTDDVFTRYTDPNGGSGYWYRFTYFSSTTAEESNLANSPAVRGGNIGIYTSVDDIRDAAGFNNAPYVTDQMIVPHRSSAQSYVDGMLGGKYVVPFVDPVNPFISDITKRLAAGYLLLDQYPTTPDRGQSKVDGAKKDLQSILSGEMTLLNATGADTTAPDGQQGNYWPNADTSLTDPDMGGGERNFRISDVQGYYGRKY